MTLRCLMPRVLAMIVLGASACPAYAQNEKERPSIPFEGPEVLCFLLNKRGFTPLPNIADLENHGRDDLLLIVFGKPDPGRRLRDSIIDLRKFQIDGGNVLLASDYTQDLPEYGVRIAGGEVPSTNDARYKDTPACPLIKPLEADAPASFGPLTHGLATNRPSYFTHVFVAGGRRPPALQPLAGFKLPLRIIVQGNLRDIRRLDEQDKNSLPRADGSRMLPYAYISDHDRSVAGRALLIAGNGIFTNSMLLQPDNDNFTFAAQCLDWLGKRPDGTPRKHALFIVDGKVIDSFDVDLKPPPLPIPPVPTPTMAVVNHLMHGVQKERLLLHILEESMAARIAVRAGLIALTLLLLCYGAKKVIELRHHAERGSVLLAGPYAVPPDTAPLVEQRARSQIERNALGAEARALVRAWFLEECAIPVANWDGNSTAPAPVAELAGGWWERRRVRRQIDRLVRLAGPALPAAFAWTDMVGLTKTLQSLTALVREGRLRLVGCSPGENS